MGGSSLSTLAQPRLKEHHIRVGGKEVGAEMESCEIPALRHGMAVEHALTAVGNTYKQSCQSKSSINWEDPSLNKGASGGCWGRETHTPLRMWQLVGYTHWTLLTGLGLLTTEKGGQEVGMQMRYGNHEDLEGVGANECNQNSLYKTMKFPKNK